MSDTTTAEPTSDAEDLVGAAKRAAEEAEGKSLATIRPEQNRWDESQIAILRQLGVEDATQGDLDLFFHYCRTTGLDPFRKQIYMIGRNTKVVEWVDGPNNRRVKNEKFVTKYTIQTGIDGYRRNGREAAKALGDSLVFDGPFWCGDDGEWRDVWTSKDAPFAAKFTVYRNGEAFTGVAHFDEFVQTNPIYSGSGDQRKKTGEEPNSMWQKMPRNQIAKCAEALAWRRAYPDDFSGLILEDTSQPTTIDQDGNPDPEAPQQRRRPGTGIGGLKAERERRQAEREAHIQDAEEVPVPDSEPVAEPESDLRKSVRQKLNDGIFAEFGKLGINGDEKRDDRMIVIRALVDAPGLASSKDLTDDQLQKLRNELVERRQAKTIDADVNEILNVEMLRRDNEAAKADEK